MRHIPSLVHLRERFARSVRKGEEEASMLLDKYFWIIALAGPLFTLPQVWKIYLTRTAAGVSLTTWSAYALLNIAWLAYGIKHQERMIILNNLFWLIVNSAVAIGVILYG